MMKSVIYVESSKNSKLGDADATYVSIKATCPTSCSLKNSGCYAQFGYIGIQLARMDNEKSTLEVAREEARALDFSYKGGRVPGRNLRLHVSGDSRTIKGTKLINSAVGRWKARGGAKVWSYTHCWKTISRKLWSNVSVLASVETVKEANEAVKFGYAPAIVVNHFNSPKAFKLAGSDIKWIPCPAQTVNRNCSNCRLCWNDKMLIQNNLGIAFEAHGVGKGKIRRHLQMINE